MVEGPRHDYIEVIRVRVLEGEHLLCRLADGIGIDRAERPILMEWLRPRRCRAVDLARTNDQQACLWRVHAAGIEQVQRAEDVVRERRFRIFERRRDVALPREVDDHLRLRPLDKQCDRSGIAQIAQDEKGRHFVGVPRRSRHLPFGIRLGEMRDKIRADEPRRPSNQHPPHVAHCLPVSLAAGLFPPIVAYEKPVVGSQRAQSRSDD